MRVRVLLFALYREQAGVRELLLDLAEGASVHSAQAALMARYPALSLHGGLAAVNQKFAQGGETLKEGDEVAFLPPVSGGGDAAKDNSYGLTEEKLDLEAYLSWASAPPYGAVVSFLGTTRSPNKGSDIAYLDYEAYSGMAEQVMGQIIGEMRQRYVLGRVAIWHRTGRVYPAEASIAIVVSSPHRPEAFEAARYAIERVKQILPVWKKEVRADGSFWVGGQTAKEFKL